MKINNMNHLVWKQSLFSNLISLQNDIINGRLRKESFSNRWSAALNGVNLRMEAKGFIRQTVSVINESDNSLIARSESALFSGSYQIVMASGQEYIWHHSGLKHRGWYISGPGGEVVKCKGRSNKGELLYENSAEVLVLLGFCLFSGHLRKNILLLFLVIFTIFIWNFR